VRQNKKLKVDPILAMCDIPIKKYLSFIDNQPIRFSENLTKDGHPAGTIEGVIIWACVPKFAQMIGGKHTDTGIVGGQPLLPTLEKPKGIVVNSVVMDPNCLASSEHVNRAPEEPAHLLVQSDSALPNNDNEKKEPSLAHSSDEPHYECRYPDLYMNSHPKNNENNSIDTKFSSQASASSSSASQNAEIPREYSTSSSSSSSQTSTATPFPVNSNFPTNYVPSTFNDRNAINSFSTSTDTTGYSSSTIALPSGWEERYDTTYNRPYYVDHNTGTTHWTLPVSAYDPSLGTVPAASNFASPYDNNINYNYNNGQPYPYYGQTGYNQGAPAWNYGQQTPQVYPNGIPPYYPPYS